ncbi:C40 family peptidase [Leifsonia sp. H3M29-4]|uniref:C40 family peptidase n=1 Tax=Salinibacterium metalliresistens TaxID=3031321 RepID=UPI0023DC51BD|nr:C40 family peptidase [Salinibacterium metalliresistens]MDF1478134.1 C40 family peptidase [Salinibacterium metalliresistens]
MAPQPETPVAPEIPKTFASPKAKRKSSFLSTAVIAVVVPGMFATVALPAYAYQGEPVDTAKVQTKVQLQQFTQEHAQSLAVAGGVTAGVADRDAFSSTSAAEMAAAAAAAAPASSYTALLANPPMPFFSLDQVVSIAMQYQGVPYVYGGATPAGFDCSGFVAYVYAQVGVSLPHGVSSAAAVGTPIAWEAALPGDMVVMPGHSGIYLGGGMMIDAPYEGRVVSVNSVWSSSAYIVRFGI